MMMKFNWGTGIFIVITLFILTVIAFFIYMSSLDINLVEDNYYEKELVYQEKIDKIANSRTLSEQIKITADKERIQIRFPSVTTGKSPEGTILFFRPSDPGLDYSIPIALNDSSMQFIDAGRMGPGRYIVKIDWSLDDQLYYHEEGLMIGN